MSDRRGNPINRWLVRAPLWQLYLYYAVVAGVIWYLISRFWASDLGVLGAVAMGLVFGGLNTSNAAQRRRKAREITGASEDQAIRLELDIQTRTVPEQPECEAMRRLLVARVRAVRRSRLQLFVMFGVLALACAVFGVLGHSTHEVVPAGVLVVLGLLFGLIAARQLRKMTWMQQHIG
jgi:Flp pilus assembly protein TadB